MYDTHNPQGHHLLVQQKLKGSFTLVYMTALSVIQGVALADLASVVAAHFQQFTLVHWLLVLVNFGILIEVWSLYTMNSILWDWIPDVRDAALPFVVGALELLLNHTIPLSLIAWLFLTAFSGCMAALAIWHLDWRARQEEENILLLNLVRGRIHFLEFYHLGAAFIIFLLAVISLLQNLQANEGLQTGRGVLPIIFVLLVGACLSGAHLLTIRYWRVLVSYARTGRIHR